MGRGPPAAGRRRAQRDVGGTLSPGPGDMLGFPAWIGQVFLNTPPTGGAASRPLDPELRRALGAAPARLRRPVRLTQGELGAPLTRAYVSAVEAGRTVPSLSGAPADGRPPRRPPLDVLRGRRVRAVQRQLTGSYDVGHAHHHPDPPARRRRPDRAGQGHRHPDPRRPPRRGADPAGARGRPVHEGVHQRPRARAREAVDGRAQLPRAAPRHAARPADRRRHRAMDAAGRGPPPRRRPVRPGARGVPQPRVARDRTRSDAASCCWVPARPPCGRAGPRRRRASSRRRVACSPRRAAAPTPGARCTGSPRSTARSTTRGGRPDAPRACSPRARSRATTRASRCGSGSPWRSSEYTHGSVERARLYLEEATDRAASLDTRRRASFFDTLAKVRSAARRLRGRDPRRHRGADPAARGGLRGPGGLDRERHGDDARRHGPLRPRRGPRRRGDRDARAARGLGRPGPRGRHAGHHPAPARRRRRGARAAPTGRSRSRPSTARPTSRSGRGSRAPRPSARWAGRTRPRRPGRTRSRSPGCHPERGPPAPDPRGTRRAAGGAGPARGGLRAPGRGRLTTAPGAGVARRTPRGPRRGVRSAR